MSNKDGMNYAPKGKVNRVVDEGEFTFGVAALDHGHINGMTNGLLEAGATLKWVYDPDPEKVKEYREQFPQAEVAESIDQILKDPEVKLVAAAAIPNERSALGNRVMKAGKDYFSDKTAFTTMEQLEETKKVVEETGQKYWVYFSERLHVEGAIFAGQLIEDGVIGDVIQITGFGPHRLNKESRPDWFFNKEQYGGILCDIGSHQIEQFLTFTGNKDAEILHSKVGNYANPDKPELEDYGDATLVGENGATFIFKVDWFTPDGLSTWGDGRMFITGTKGTIEVRKYVDVAKEESGDHVYLVNEEGEKHYHVSGEVGFPFFGEMIKDCIDRTENAMTQEHIFKAQELCILAQEKAIRVKN
ncbi:Predicted dehydrogenase [Alkalibacterium putridalgicola]|uniref:Oxidoreductase n=1 Tax=Alkalibacterium putridalgicola TaxID=426703 RepID=A0A1H7U3E7_9LACT|nr:Gfo/Idh/MocA family oxidoreductase [Alkalibacterium putridalgicola]GEK89489.1 oxidoreductase [Alkalibacterium putridalgicola]SEL91289.1 Predicted dehydrogenase [Alkalibacterium putridalgicola]